MCVLYIYIYEYVHTGVYMHTHTYIHTYLYAQPEALNRFIIKGLGYLLFGVGKQSHETLSKLNTSA